MSSDWKQNLYEIGSAGGMALAALLFVAAVIRWETIGEIFLYAMVILLFVLCVIVPIVALVVWVVSW